MAYKEFYLQGLSNSSTLIMRANYFVGMFEENTDTETHTHMGTGKLSLPGLSIKRQH